MTALILHIGTEKTGTTSIQEFLGINRARLAEQGVHVPAFLGERTHRWAAYMAENVDRIDYFSIELGLAEDGEKRQARKQEIRAQLEAEVALHPECRWLISSEHLQSRLTTQEEVERLAAILQPLFSEIQIVVYLRHPLATAVSYWSMRVKGGAPLLALGEPGSFGHHICDHRGILERWMAAFASATFTVRLFEHQSFVAGDLIRDFCEACGVEWHQNLAMPARLNETLSYQAIRLLARINEKVPRWLDGRINPNRAALASSFLESFASFPPYRPSRSEQERYSAFYRDSEEWVRATFFPQRERLWSEVEVRDDEDPRVDAGLDPLETALIDVVVRLCHAL
jgi:hypothetical protein